MTDKLGSEPAFPYVIKETRESALQRGKEPIEITYGGLTKRQWFAGMAIIGITANPTNIGKNQHLAEAAFSMADAMLKEGDK